jgi:hypothetical protein
VRWLALLLALGACSAEPPAPADNAGVALEQAAIARGVIRDPASSAITGLYAREGDRLCVIDRGTTARIGAFIDYGDGIGCTARGSVARKDDALAVDFGGGCTFDAGFDGDRIRIPGALPAACERLCTRRASLAGLAVERLSGSASEAQALRDPNGRALCG